MLLAQKFNFLYKNTKQNNFNRKLEKKQLFIRYFVMYVYDITFPCMSNIQYTVYTCRYSWDSTCIYLFIHFTNDLSPLHTELRISAIKESNTASHAKSNKTYCHAARIQIHNTEINGVFTLFSISPPQHFNIPCSRRINLALYR